MRFWGGWFGTRQFLCFLPHFLFLHFLVWGKPSKRRRWLTLQQMLWDVRPGQQPRSRSSSAGDPVVSSCQRPRLCCASLERDGHGERRKTAGAVIAPTTMPTCAQACRPPGDFLQAPRTSHCLDSWLHASRPEARWRPSKDRRPGVWATPIQAIQRDKVSKNGDMASGVSGV